MFIFNFIFHNSCGCRTLLFITIFAGDVTQNNLNLPWAPKVPTFNVTSTPKSAIKAKNPITQLSVPGLMPILPSTTRGIPRRLYDNDRMVEDHQAELLRLQFDNQIIEQVEQLRLERQQFMKQLEQNIKENEVLKVKLSQMNDQLQRYKKKADQNQSGKENVNPNKGKSNEDANVDPIKEKSKEDGNVNQIQGKGNEDTNSQVN